jgi:hypothetical protein
VNSDVTDEDEWWNVDKQPVMKEHNWSENQIERFDLDHIQIRKNKEEDDNNIHSCYDFRSKLYKNISGRVCYPRVVVTGQAKAGTSALFAFLKMHPNSVQSKSGGKENCFPTPSNRTLLHYLRSLEYSVEPNKILIDGCINPIHNMVLRRSILKDPKVLYIFLTRDYADLLWSGYNYWCDESVDQDCIESRWAIPSHIRNPRHFDKMIRHVNKTTPVLPFLYNSLENANSFYKNLIQYLYRYAGEENVCINKNIIYNKDYINFYCK